MVTYSASSKLENPPISCKQALSVHTPTVRKILKDTAKLRNSYLRKMRSELFVWDGHQQNSYNRTFMSALNGMRIEDYAQSRKDSGKSTHLLDLFGSAVFTLEQDPFDSMTGVRLINLDPREIPYGLKKSEKWRELTGDLGRKYTWKKLDSNLDARNIEALDIILIRPVGPLKDVAWAIQANQDQRLTNSYLGLFYLVLNRAWERLSDSEGLILLKYENSLQQLSAIKAWHALLEAQGFDWNLTGHDHDILRLIKHKSSPLTLPKLTQDSAP